MGLAKGHGRIQRMDGRARGPADMTEARQSSHRRSSILPRHLVRPARTHLHRMTLSRVRSATARMKLVISTWSIPQCSRPPALVSGRTQMGPGRRTVVARREPLSLSEVGWIPR